MRLAFIVERSNYYKFYSPVIAEARRRGYQVHCWHQNSRTSTNGKSYLSAGANTSPFRPDEVTCAEYESADELQRLASTIGVDALVTLTPVKSALSSILSSSNVKVITLQNSLDTFLYGTPETLASSNRTCVYSQYWLDWASKYFAAQGSDTETQFESMFLPKSALTGFPELDAVAGIDPTEVRKRWGIPLQQPVVLLLPITLANQSGSWARVFSASNRWSQLKTMVRRRNFDQWQLLSRGWNDATLTDAIHQFCKRNGAYLLVKGRRKDPVRPWLGRVADKILYDETERPPTILEALSVANVCIHFYSTVAIEAAFVGCPTLCIHRPNADDSGRVPLYTQLWRHGEEGHVFNFKGVASWNTIPEVIETLPSLALDHFRVEPQARVAYVEKFLGRKDTQSSKRVLDVIASIS